MLDIIREHWQTAVLVVLGIYDVLARLIPTVENYSLLHKIISFLKWISEGLNIKK